MSFYPTYEHSYSIILQNNAIQCYITSTLKHSALICQSTDDYTTTIANIIILINMFAVLITIHNLILAIIATSVLQKLLSYCLLRYFQYLIYQFYKHILLVL